MKPILLSLFVALLMVGCGESPNPSGGVDMTDTAPKKDAIETAVDWSKLQDRSGVTYLPNTDKPFSGYAKRAYENEQVEILAEFKEGYIIRLKQWQENGNPRWDVGLIEGKVGIEGMPLRKLTNLKIQTLRHGSFRHWHENGQKSYEGNFKDSKPDGLMTSWYENGQKWWEENYKDGKQDGLFTYWYEGNGQKVSVQNWRNGKLMSAEGWKPNGEKCPVTKIDEDGNGFLVMYKEDGTESSRLTIKDGKLVD